MAHTTPNEIAIHNPANPSERVATYAPTDVSDLPEVMHRAQAAQASWREVPQTERGALVAAFLDALDARTEEIATAITGEMGKTLAEARGEVGKSASEGRLTAARAGSMIGEVLPAQRADMAYSTRRPRGVIAGLCPWNFPFGTPVRKTIPALVYGNAMVLKPSELAPGAAMCMQEVAAAVLPSDLLQIVIGDGALGSALTARAELDGISFTGSVRTGRQVAVAAAGNLVEVSLELGGKNAAIINDASDIDRVLDQVFAAAFAISGQRCTAISRVIVKADLGDRVVAGLNARAQAARLGDGMDAETTMGPLVSRRQLETVSGFVDRAAGEGATVSTGGTSITTPTGGFFYAPTILSGVRPEMEIAREEVFGPVLSVLTYETFDEALDIANDVAYGLTASLFSEQAPLVERFVAECETGMMHVNSGSFPEDHAPFVGMKESAFGVGGSNGPSTMHFYTSEHAVYRKGHA